ncbi:quinoprotein glucose dehydrogenase [Advenella mimigardefordensis DPN7]|uniref:Quinoprotein glucose dehydrogenase n=2 Tax=Advenella mimigardefordensis TaxID=302406 RepID=W0PG18_ADVMD|nr:quinoprotein glucose dehydrogenase [Advenella mimigardefordensis DPN7]
MYSQPSEQIMNAIAALLTLLSGLVLAAGGGWLLSLGGSIYYVSAGIVLLITAFLLFNRRPFALVLYAAFLIGTAVWAFFESGYDWWPLAARLGFFLILGIILLLPGVAHPKRSRLESDRRMASNETTNAKAVLAVITIVIAIGTLGSIANPTHELEGQLPDAVVSAEPDMGNNATTGDNDWHAYGRTGYGQRYSPLSQITPENVSKLKLAWSYQTGDVKGEGDTNEFTYQATPIKIGNTLYLCTPHNWAIALDADTGEKKWEYKADVVADGQRQHQTCRGLSYWAGDAAATGAAASTASETATATADNGQADAASATPAPAAASTGSGAACSSRLFLPTATAKLIALDPQTGEVCKDFADNGQLDLTHNMPFKQHGYYYSTSPPVVANGKIVVAGAVNDNYDINSPSGVIRAYDVRSGKLLWNWDSGNPDDTAPFDPNNPDQKYTVSSPNSWSVGSVDEKLGLVYFPMGNRTPDQLGRYRNEHEEKYATSVVALDLNNGQAKWVHQFIHHDLWDMDTPAQPTLMDISTASGVVPSLVVPTKQGDIYVLDRRTGDAVLPVREVKAPQGTIEGEHSAPTQPESALNFKPDPLTEGKMWGGTPFDQLWCRIQFKTLRYEGQYTPPSLQGTIVYPGNFGVFNWGGIAVDPKRQVMFGMPLQLAFVSQLVPKEALGKDVQMNVGEQGVNSNEGAPYAVNMHPFLSPLGVPCQQPPWGSVAGVDLRTGKTAWKHKNGTIHDLSPLPLPITMGVPGIGGPMITGSGVVFMGAAVDDYLRAYDLTTGKVLWDARLPAGGQATPMTYLNSKNEQMVVLVVGGHGSIGTKLGDYVMAYKLAQ